MIEVSTTFLCGSTTSHMDYNTVCLLSCVMFYITGYLAPLVMYILFLYSHFRLLNDIE